MSGKSKKENEGKYECIKAILLHWLAMLAHSWTSGLVEPCVVCYCSLFC